MSSHWKAVLGVILIFVFGCVAGWLSRSVVAYRQTTLLLQRGPEGVVELLERRMTRTLGLDANQAQQIHSCLMQNLAQRKQLQLQIQPQVQALNLQTLQQINAVLRPDQQERLREELIQLRRRLGKSSLNSNADNLPQTDTSPAIPPANPTSPSH